jgi:putative phosphoesterase
LFFVGRKITEFILLLVFLKLEDSLNFSYCFLMKKILLLSDTHSFIDAQILKFVKQADEVWHVGDIGDLNVTDTIKKLKPLRAVFGNIDDHDARAEFPLDLKFEVEKVTVWMTHIGGYPNNYYRRIREEIKENPPQIFISGHSHILKVQYDKKLNLLHLNPGAAGNHGFHKIRTMLRFNLENREIKNLEIIELAKRG